jgi:hypothetical protein
MQERYNIKRKTFPLSFVLYHSETVPLKNCVLNLRSLLGFDQKIAIYKRPSYRRSLQPAKENIQHFKTQDFSYKI